MTVKYRPSLRRTSGEITLSGRVPWAIKARMGMSDVVADLEDLEFTGLEISGGVSRLEVQAASPQGGRPGSDRCRRQRPRADPARRGARPGPHRGWGLEAGHRRRPRRGRRGKTDWRSPDYDLVKGRYDIEIGAGASKVTVRT